MQIWILAGLGVLALLGLALLAIWRSRRGTVFVFQSDGFSAFRMGPEPSFHKTDKMGLQKAIIELLSGDSLDGLWVSRKDDDYSGVIIVMEGGAPVLNVSLQTRDQQDQILELRKAMAAAGFSGSEDSEGFSGGFAEEHRCTSIEYRLGDSPEEVMDATQQALDVLDPTDGPDYYVKALSFREVIDSTSGAKYVPDRDPLQNIL